MLKFFRNKSVTKLVLWALLILILPAFVLWGTGNLGRSGKGPKYAGTIDGRNISFEDFHKSIMHIRSQIILNYFDQPRILDAFLKNRPLMGKLAWDRLLMENEARKEGIKVTNTEVVEYIKSHPIFLRGGVFDDRAYNYILRQSIGLDPRGFEEIIRQNLAIQKMNNIVSKDITVSDEEVIRAYRKENEQFAVSYILFSSDEQIEDVKIDEESIKKYYEDNKRKFVVPSPGQEKPQAAKFDEVKDSIREHLAAEAARKLALDKADKEHARIDAMIQNNNTTLEQAAAKRGLKIKTLKPFAGNDYLDNIGEANVIVDTAVDMNIGDISGPVEVRKGAMIFKITEVKEYDRKKFEEEKDEFKKKVIADKKNDALEDWLRALEDKNKPNIDFDDYEKYIR